MIPAPQETSNNVQPQCGRQNNAPPPEMSTSLSLKPENVNRSVT